MGYSSSDCTKNAWIGGYLKFISNEHEDNIPLISKDPGSLSNLNQLEDDDNASSGSDDSYHSCNQTIPSKKDKQVFFNFLKHFLEDQSILQEGNEEECWCDKNKLKLKYMGRKCNALILDGDGNKLWEGIIETKNIYLNWRGDEVEPLSLENLQIVQNTLEFLGIQNKKVHDCFSLARTQLMEEPNWVQKNMKLKIICCEVILTFGKGKNLATVLYDNIKKIPKYNMEMAHWYTKLLRNHKVLLLAGLLKKLLQTLSSLQNGEEAQDQCDEKILSLTYWTENFQVAVLKACGQTQFSKCLPVQEIYLQYGEGLMEKTLSAENLQHVQNDLKLLGIQSKEIHACFSLSKTKFTKELQCLQKSMILKIICDDIILSFLSDKPVYNINVANWWIRLGRWFWVVTCELGTTTRALSGLLSATESLMKSLTLL
ncbi:hypothetical protein E2320_014579, partial [Naja naja]